MKGCATLHQERRFHNMISERIRCLFGRHEDKFIRNIYGDEINLVGGRSLWRCGHCGKKQYRNFLFKKVYTLDNSCYNSSI